MLSLIGKDKPGIVAQVTRILFENGANLGEATMQRLGGYFTIMLMYSNVNSHDVLKSKIQAVADELELTMHIDPFDGELHKHLESDVCVTLYGADRTGIVATATEKLACAGLHILSLDTDVGGSVDDPIFVMEIEGCATQGIDVLRESVADIPDVEINITAIDTLLA